MQREWIDKFNNDSIFIKLKIIEKSDNRNLIDFFKRFNKEELSLYGLFSDIKELIDSNEECLNYQCYSLYSDCLFGITEDDRIIGLVLFYDHDIVNRKIKIGYIRAPSESKKGLMSHACSFLISLFFENLRINKIKAYILHGNQKSINFIKKLGFHEEGMLKEEILINNVFHNLSIYCLINKTKLL